MLTYADVCRHCAPQAGAAAGTQFTCITGTKVKILTQKALQYAAAAQVVRDVMLCFDNAIKYNPPANAVHEQVC
jgi:hypothetical protein